MKKIGQLMKEMGFNENGTDAAKEAFIKYLIKQSTGVNVTAPGEKKIIAENPQKILKFPTQLEFSFDDKEDLKIKKAGE